MLRKHSRVLLILPFLVTAQQSQAQSAPAEPASDLKQILDRLERLEQENRNLASEVRALRTELSGSRSVATTAQSFTEAPQPALEGRQAEAAGSVPAPAGVQASAQAAAENGAPGGPPIAEQLAVHDRRIDDLAQTKVESSQKLPVSLTGMLLFNSYINGAANNGEQNPVAASLAHAVGNGGASMSQSIVGLTYRGPQVWGGGRVSAAAYLDLWGGTSSSLNHLMRLRVATVSVDWKNQSLMVGQDKPIVSPRDPTSLAQVAFSPLTAAGNPWLWQPQVRFEQRVALGDTAGLRARIGVYQTNEPAASAGVEYASTLAPARPGLEGRFEFWKEFGSGARIEIAPGFHTSNTHVAGLSIPSRLFTIDWMLRPVRKVEVTGMFFGGENPAGIGALRQGFTLGDAGRHDAVHALGGWAQVSYQATSRLSFNAYSGQESNRASDLLTGLIARNFEYAGNAQYRIASNVVLGIEASQIRTSRVNAAQRLNNHYDLALAYLF